MCIANKPGSTESALDTQKNSMSATIYDMQQDINSQQEESQILANNIAKQHMDLQEARNATSAVEIENDTTLVMQEEHCALQASILVAQERYTKLQKDTQKTQKQSNESNDALTKTRNSLNDEIAQASTVLQNTQTDLQETTQEVEIRQAQHMHLVAEYDAEAAQYCATSAQQMAHWNEMQANVDCMLANKQKIMQNIEVLSLSHDDYTQKLDKIQLYSNGLHMAMFQLRDSMQLQKNSAEFHVCMENILDLFGSFLDWFESNFTHKLHVLSCLMLNSQIE